MRESRREVRCRHPTASGRRDAHAQDAGRTPGPMRHRGGRCNGWYGPAAANAAVRVEAPRIPSIPRHLSGEHGVSSDRGERRPAGSPRPTSYVKLYPAAGSSLFVRSRRAADGHSGARTRRRRARGALLSARSGSSEGSLPSSPLGLKRVSARGMKGGLRRTADAGQRPRTSCEASYDLARFIQSDPRDLAR